MTMLPKEFVKSLESILPAGEVSQLCDAIDNTEPSVAVRFNPFKVSEKPEGCPIPWSRYGFTLDERPQFTLDPLFHAGAYYVQEPASMFVEHIYRSLVGDKAKIKLLDLCAAPGGKTTVYSTMAGLEGLVVANEVVRPRAMALADNVTKWGLGNVVVTNNDTSHFAGFRNYFDVVAVDAPCSGEGMFRKDVKSREEWSPDLVKLCAARQRRILSDIWDSLKPGGILIYSTCTYNTTENEDVVKWLCEEFLCEGVKIDVPHEWNIVTGEIPQDNGDSVPTFRFYPHRINSEGFFASVIRKGGQGERPATPKPRRAVFTDITGRLRKELGTSVCQPEFMHFAQVGENIHAYYENTFKDISTVCNTLSVIYSGVMAGQVFKEKLKPEHPMALFHDLNRDNFNACDLPLDAALDFLRKQNLPAGPFSEGMNLVTYAGFPIGWLKRIGNRVNNMYPKEMRIFNL